MNEAIVVAWSSYRRVVDLLYPPANDRRFLVGDDDPDLLDRLVRESERFRAVLFEALSADDAAGEREELETAAYAAAALDVRIGANVLVSYLDQEAGPEQGFEVLLESQPMSELLRDADPVFRGIGGASPGSPHPRVRAGQAIGELVVAGAGGANAFASSIVGAGIGAGAAEVFDAVHDLDWLSDRASEIGGKLKCGLKLIDLGLRKLAALVGVDQLVELGLELLLKPVEWILGRRVEPLGTTAVRWAVREARAHAMTAAALDNREAPPRRKPFEVSLDRLCRKFEKNMRWARRISKVLGVIAPILTVLSLGMGQTAVLGVVCVGLIVCLCNLADRLDTLPEGFYWVPGVPSIARTSP